MADIFLSYASENRERARALVDVLQAQGWSVWWDRELKPGPEYDTVIQQELRAAVCVVVLWSEAATASRWVRAEADDAAQRACLVPALIEPVEIPLGFRMIQAADLTSWEDGSESPGMTALLASVRSSLRRSRQELTVVPTTTRRRRARLIAAAAVPLVAFGSMALAPMPRFRIQLSARASALMLRTAATTDLLAAAIRSRRVVLTGITGVALPRPDGTVQTIEADQVALEAAQPGAELWLRSLIAADTGVVTVRAEGGGGWSLSASSPGGLTLRLRGRILVRAAGQAAAPHDFDDDSLRVYFADDDLGVTFWPLAGPPDTLINRLPVLGLAFRSAELGAPSAGEEAASTILGGTVRSGAGVRDSIRTGENLTLARAEGLITRVDPSGGSALLVEFTGTARGVTVGDGPAARQLRPRVAGWMVHDHPLMLLAAGLGYLALVVIVRRWKRRA